MVPIGIVFCGDDCITAMGVQINSYPWVVQTIFSRAREVFLDAERLVRGTKSPLAALLQETHSCAPRTLEEAYAVLAADFRFKRPQLCQDEFPFDGLSFSQRIERDWRLFVSDQSRDLMTQAPFARLIVTAVAYEGLPEGEEARKELLKKICDTLEVGSACYDRARGILRQPEVPTRPWRRSPVVPTFVKVTETLTQKRAERIAFSAPEGHPLNDIIERAKKAARNLRYGRRESDV